MRSPWVVQYGPGLIYLNQSGALNESFADTFGALVDSDDWLVEDDIGRAFRSLSNPNLYEEPDATTDFDHHRCTSSDSGGVHTNSGIPNHAFYLMVVGSGGSEPTHPGLGRTTGGLLLYNAYHRLTSSSDFGDYAFALRMACAELHPPAVGELHSPNVERSSGRLHARTWTTRVQKPTIYRKKSLLSEYGPSI